MWEFILERYNYWVAIVLMMIGLYIVISRGNLVKTIIGLNLFQTSVFIFYISIGKIAGGTAPIYTKDDYHPEAGHGDGHGESHGETHGGEAETHDAASIQDHNIIEGDHGGDAATDHSAASHHDIPDAPSNSLDVAMQPSADVASTVNHTTYIPDLHAMPDVDFAAHDVPDAVFEVLPSNIPATLGDVIYTNPIPHVLILTAIVVGVATTAVGLALAVRIREAYGSIEEDELEAADDIAEFGRVQTQATGRVL